MKRFNEIRDALDLAKIPYKHKVRNQNSEWIFLGKGTKRSQFGSIGVDRDKAYEYEILVRKEDKKRQKNYSPGNKSYKDEKGYKYIMKQDGK